MSPEERSHFLRLLHQMAHNQPAQQTIALPQPVQSKKRNPDYHVRNLADLPMPPLSQGATDEDDDLPARFKAPRPIWKN